MARKILQGSVVSDKNDKTIIVKVDRSFPHPKYKKIVRKSKKYSAHDPENHYKVGDKVTIQESSPISKTKKWKVIK